MQKVISLFKRDYEGTRLVFNEVVEGAEWVLSGEGVATEKIDGTSCLVKDGNLYKRYDAKNGKTPPANFMPSQKPDPVTGHWPGWLPVSEDNPNDKWHCSIGVEGLRDGTYELIGPKIQGNKYSSSEHMLILHGNKPLIDAPRDFSSMKSYFENHPEYEGIVWWHTDGRMVKIKRRDFGLSW